MANKSKSNLSPTKAILTLAKSAQDNISALYKNTFFSTPDNKNNLERIKNDIDKNIDHIMSKNIADIGTPNTSKLISRLRRAQGDKATIEDISNVFNDKNLMDSLTTAYMQNTFIKDLDAEIDTVTRYMPKLLEALDTRKDNVLSSDHFSKDFLNLINVSNISDQKNFINNIKDMKKKYELQDIIDDAYDKAAMYGEAFIYNVDYAKALNRLLSTKGNTDINAKISLTESSIIEYTDASLTESVAGGTVMHLEGNPIPVDQRKDLPDFILEINNSHMLTEAVKKYQYLSTARNVIREMSINESTDSKTYETGFMPQNLNYDDIDKADKSLSSKIKVKTAPPLSKDGLVDVNATRDQLKNKLNVPGCIVKRIEDRANIFPIYIDNMCLGYYYFEFNEADPFSTFSDNISNADPMNNTSRNSRKPLDLDPTRRDQMLRYVSANMSRYIDSKFINANYDLRKEIYMILKHNDVFNSTSTDKVRVTFLPPEDVEHIYFKKDPITNRGISDLARALIPAKLYCSLYITNTLAILTRGQDKRVYYVKQSVDTNISKLLLNTINQIKRSNFGIRQIESMKNILNVVGRFHDYVIPVGPNGDSPIQFEMMQGQNIEVKTELMNILEEMAVNSTDVPLELIQARQSIDYAVQLTMTNSKFLKKVYNRQSKFEVNLSRIVTRIYNSEYNKKEEIEVTLPPPMFLNVANTNQMMDNTTQFVNSILESETAIEDDDKLKAYILRKVKRYFLNTYIDFPKIEELITQARHEYEASGKSNEAS